MSSFLFLGIFRVISFHNEAGQVVDLATAAGPQVLKAVGDAATPTAAVSRRVANIKYVTVETNIDFTQITEDNLSRFRVYTVIELPMPPGKSTTTSLASLPLRLSLIMVK